MDWESFLLLLAFCYHFKRAASEKRQEDGGGEHGTVKKFPDWSVAFCVWRERDWEVLGAGREKDRDGVRRGRGGCVEETEE
jgi:hypothetical protein